MAISEEEPENVTMAKAKTEEKQTGKTQSKKAAKEMAETEPEKIARTA